MELACSKSPHEIGLLQGSPRCWFKSSVRGLIAPRLSTSLCRPQGSAQYEPGLAYSDMLMPRCSLQCLLRAGVTTLRCLLRGALPKVPTPKCLCQSAYSKVPTLRCPLRDAYSKAPIPRCLLGGACSKNPSYRLRGVYSEVLTLMLFNPRLPTLRSLRSGAHVHTDFPRHASLCPGSSAKDPPPRCLRPGAYAQPTPRRPRSSTHPLF